MTETRARPAPATPVPAPTHPAPARVMPGAAPVPLVITAPDPPGRLHQLLPRNVRTVMVQFGLWEEPRPLKPSAHLLQVNAVLERYGWCKAWDFAPSGRMCIRGAMTFLHQGGYVTDIDRDKAVNYLQTALSWTGSEQRFWEWNDTPGIEFKTVQSILSTASDMARKNGE